MFTKILGWFWLIMGVLYLIKPQLLQWRLSKKTSRKVRRFLLLLTFFLVFSLGGVFLKLNGFWPKAILFLGILGVFRIIFALRAKTSKKLIEWLAKQSLVFFRIFALIYIGIGLVMLNLFK